MTEVWQRNAHTTPGALLERRLAEAPDAPYLDVTGTALTAAQVDDVSRRIATALAGLGVGPGDRVATFAENSPEAALAWWGIVRGGHVAVPVNTAFKGAFLRHQLADAGARVLIVQRGLLDRAVAVVDHLPDLTHLVVVDDGSGTSPTTDDLGTPVIGWQDVLAAEPAGELPTPRPGDLATFVYTGGTTGPSKGCMLSHAYHVALAQQCGVPIERRADDVLWTPLPLYHFNAIVHGLLGPLLFGGSSAISRRFSVSGFWPEIARTSATLAGLLGSMTTLLARDVDRPEMPSSGEPAAATTLRMIFAAPLPPDIDEALRTRFGVDTFSGGYGVTEASLISSLPPGVPNKPGAAGRPNTDYFDVRLFDDDDHEVPDGEQGEIVIRPTRPHVMFEGYWGRPEATVSTSRNWWYHTGDIGRIDDDGYLFFVDRKADYLRRRGENVSSVEVERILMGHEAVAEVAMHSVPSELTEDDLKVTVVLRDGATLTEAELFVWAVDQLPYFALPRYIEVREQLPATPLGRVLKRQLRDEGVTPATWDVEASDVVYERR
jgi:crotonobetaine/carnitine-CoA ligase